MAVAGLTLVVVYGIGQPRTSIPATTLVKYLKILYSGPTFYAGAIVFTKLSILFLYHTAFPSRYIRHLVWILSSIVTAWSLSCVFVAVFACNPIHKAWVPAIAGKCINYKAYYYGLPIPNIITDFAIRLLPVKAVLDLQLPPRQTLQISAVRLLAGVNIAFAIVRLVVLLRLNNGGGDFTQDQVSLSMWTDVEPSVAMLVACLPIMQPLLQPRHFLSRRKEEVHPAPRSDNFENPSRASKEGYDPQANVVTYDMIMSSDESSHDL